MKTQEQIDAERVIPSFDDIKTAYTTLGDLLHSHFNVNTKPEPIIELKKPNKLSSITTPDYK